MADESIVNSHSFPAAAAAGELQTTTTVNNNAIQLPNSVSTGCRRFMEMYNICMANEGEQVRDALRKTNLKQYFAAKHKANDSLQIRFRFYAQVQNNDFRDICSDSIQLLRTDNILYLLCIDFTALNNLPCDQFQALIEEKIKGLNSNGCIIFIVKTNVDHVKELSKMSAINDYLNTLQTRGKVQILTFALDYTDSNVETEVLEKIYSYLYQYTKTNPESLYNKAEPVTPIDFVTTTRSENTSLSVNQSSGRETFWHHPEAGPAITQQESPDAKGNQVSRSFAKQ